MSPTSDPRSHVTPDAFSIAPSVLGLPLASPKRRLAALAIDGILIGIVAQLDWRILGVVAAIAFFRAATRRSTNRRLGRAFQTSAGCLGALILFVTVIAGTELVRSLLFPEPDATAESEAPSLRDALGGLDAVVRFSQVETEDEAVEVGLELIRRADGILGTTPDETLGFLRENLPTSADIDADRVIERITDELGIEEPVLAVDGIAVDSLSQDQAWATYLQLGQRDSLSADEEVTLAAVRNRLTAMVASDTLTTLVGALADARETSDQLDQRLQSVRRDLEAERESGGLFAWIIETVDELGLTFGWGALYLATFTTMMKGQTPGKRLFGIRVLRLDGHPMGWFHAFERAGGYAAGVATGMLGFFQVFWDPNRQGIHDKVVATVVVREGAPKAPVKWVENPVRRTPPTAPRAEPPAAPKPAGPKVEPAARPEVQPQAEPPAQAKARPTAEAPTESKAEPPIPPAPPTDG